MFYNIYYTKNLTNSNIYSNIYYIKLMVFLYTNEQIVNNNNNNNENEIITWPTAIVNYVIMIVKQKIRASEGCWMFVVPYERSFWHKVMQHKLEFWTYILCDL